MAFRSLHAPAARDEVITRLRTLGPEARRRWGCMSVGQMFCHATDVLRATLGDLPTHYEGRVPFRNFPLRTLVVYVLPWPRGMRVPAELLSTAPADLERDRALLESWIARFGQAGHRSEWPGHPLFGPLSRDEWGRFSYRHLDHHLRQFSA